MCKRNKSNTEGWHATNNGHKISVSVSVLFLFSCLFFDRLSSLFLTFPQDEAQCEEVRGVQKDAHKKVDSHPLKRVNRDATNRHRERNPRRWSLYVTHRHQNPSQGVMLHVPPGHEHTKDGKTKPHSSRSGVSI